MSRGVAGKPARASRGARIVEFAVGANFWHGASLVRILRIAGADKVLIEHLANHRLEHVSTDALRACEPRGQERFEAPTPTEIYPAAVWERARAIRRSIDALEARPSRRAETRTAQALGVSARHLRRWRVRYRALGTLEAFLPRRSGRKRGSRLLSPRLEELIDEEAHRALKRSADAAVNDLYPLVAQAAQALHARIPARSTVARRLAVLKRDPANFAPETARALNAQRQPVRGRLATAGALSVVQIDHTLADVILIDPLERRPIGRPWLTLALDVHTRMVLGMLVSLEAPSSLSVALALDHAVFPKKAWSEQLGVQADAWPAFGLPARLHLDNGVEFHARALIRGCELYGIGLDYRPIATPRFGGHIERLIGTVMGKVKLLPGATDSRVLKGRPKAVERHARLTMVDLTTYLARQIGIYHHTTHSTLNRSPHSAWEAAMKRRGEWRVPQIPSDRQAFLVRFLPSALRTVTREGVRLFALRYQSSELERLIEPHRPRFVRYDPRDLSRIYVEDGQSPALAVPLNDRHYPALSLWEWREIRRAQLAGAGSGDAEWVARALRANQALIAERARVGRARDRRRLERARQWRDARALPRLHADRDLTVSAKLNDTPLPCEVLE